MKKTIATIAILGAVASSVFAQGLVFFSGGSAASTRISTNTVVGGASTGTTAAAGGGFYYALFASAANTTSGSTSTAINGVNANYVFDNSSGWTLVGIGTNTLSTGRFAASTQGSSNQGNLNADGSLSVSGIGGGANAHFVVVGWSSNIGSTLAAVQAWYDGGQAFQGFIGQSAVGTGLALGDGALVNTSNAIGTGAGQVGGFLLGLTPVAITPEPGTMVLAGLGGLALLGLRRKK
jgi:PEP-CTERM motif